MKKCIFLLLGQYIAFNLLSNTHGCCNKLISLSQKKKKKNQVCISPFSFATFPQELVNFCFYSFFSDFLVLDWHNTVYSLTEM